ncbi:MAG: hypothetical protein ACLTKG_04260 [Collinsella intestinalis]
MACATPIFGDCAHELDFDSIRNHTGHRPDHAQVLLGEEGSMLPRVAPELSPRTYWYYKPAHYIEQTWSVRAAGVRQRHIDQAQSMNLYMRMTTRCVRCSDSISRHGVAA